MDLNPTVGSQKYKTQTCTYKCLVILASISLNSVLKDSGSSMVAQSANIKSHVRYLRFNKSKGNPGFAADTVGHIMGKKLLEK